MKVKVKKLSEGAVVPTYKTEGSAGMDLSALLTADVVIAPLTSSVVPTGLAIELSHGLQGEVRSRSGLAANNTVMVLNSPGTIDSDYRGEIKVILMNLSNVPFTVKNGDRIAQLVVDNYTKVQIELVSDLSDTQRGDGGLGSTGV